MITEVERAIVSTHSRPKAAVRITLPLCTPKSFNTQPPEGGWLKQAFFTCQKPTVSTHSRLKAAGLFSDGLFYLGIVSTHSRPKAAGRRAIGGY